MVKEEEGEEEERRLYARPVQRKKRSTGFGTGFLAGPFLGHRRTFREQFTGAVSPASEWPCNVLQTFYRGGQRSAGGGERAVNGDARRFRPVEDIVPNVWTCVPLRSRLLLSYSMHVCPLKMLF